jgi:hypothetical protein
MHVSSDQLIGRFIRLASVTHRGFGSRPDDAKGTLVRPVRCPALRNL